MSDPSDPGSGPVGPTTEPLRRWSEEVADPPSGGDDEARPKPHRDVNPVALIAGFLYVAIGGAALVEQRWSGIDLGALAGAGALVAGIVAVVLLARARTG